MSVFLVDSLRVKYVTWRRSSAPSARPCPRCRRPKGTRSRPARCGGRASSSPASPTGRSCRPTRGPSSRAEEQAFLDNETDELCRLTQDWECTQQRRHARRGLAVHQGQGLPRHDHSQGVRRQGLLGLRPLPGRHQAVDALLGPRGHRDGAQLARPGRVAAALRHARAEAALPAAPGLRRGDPGLCAHQPVGGLRRRLHSRRRRGVQGRVERRGSARHARQFRQALHHARAGVHRVRPRLPSLRPGPAARRRRGARHHLRADPARPPRRRHRSPPLPAQRGVDERPGARQGRVRAARVHHRRAEDGRPGLAHADGVPGRRAQHLAARLQHRHAEDGGARRRRLCPRALPVQDRDRPLRGRGRGADPHRRQHLPVATPRA